MSFKKDALWYWQDKLAKFFPTSMGPTNTEKAMFEYGYLEGVNSYENNLAIAMEALEDIAYNNMSSQGFVYEAKAQEALSKIKRLHAKS